MLLKATATPTRAIKGRGNDGTRRSQKMQKTCYEVTGDGKRFKKVFDGPSASTYGAGASG